MTTSPAREPARHVTAALRRRKRLVAAQAGAVVGGTLLLLGMLPRSYHVEARVLARPEPVLSALSNPERTVRREDPARLAAAAVMKRANLERLVRDAGLAESWAASRAPLRRALDRAAAAWRGAPSPEDRIDALVDVLEKRLYVQPQGATVAIGVDWPDGPSARAIVERSLETFLEERRLMEVSSVEDTVAILDRHRDRADGTMAAMPVSVPPAADAFAVEDGGRLWQQSRAKMAAAEYDRLSRRLTDARIELAGAKADFARRYPVAEPPRLPRRPVRPDVAAVLVAAVLAGLLLGAVSAVAVDVRAAHRPPAEPVWRGGFGVLLAALALATVAAVIAGNGRLAVAVAPALVAAVIYILWAAPARTSALALLFLVLALENPGDAGGRWQSPWHTLGALLLANLNLTLPVRALRFTGLDVVMVLLIAVILVRRAVRARVDRSEVTPARPMAWAAAAWLGAVLSMWAYGLARGGDFRNSLWQCHQLVVLPFAYFVFRSALRGPRDHGALARVIVAAACVKAGLALWVRATVSASADVLPTATSHGDSVLFACAAAVVVALLVEQAVPGRAAAAGAVLVLLAAGMLANNRRLAWVELAAALAAVYAIAARTRVKRALRQAALLAAPALVLYAAVGWTSGSRLFRPVATVRSLLAPHADWSTGMRDIENFNLLWTLRDHPLVGTGFGHEYVEKVKAVDISSIFPQYRYVPHNTVLGLLAFGGVIGLSAVLLTLVVAVYLAARAHRFAVTPAHRAAALAVIAGVIVFLIQCYGDMGFMSWTGAFTLAPALAVAGQLAPATGAWPAPGAPDLSGGR